MHLIKLTKFANDLGVTKATLWNWKNKGLIQFIKRGSLNFVNEETYNSYLNIKSDTAFDRDMLMKEFIDVIDSYCLRIYGKEIGKIKSEKITEDLNA